MKNILLMIVLGLVFITAAAQESRLLKDVNDKVLNLDSLAGRKVVLVILPSQKDTTITNQLLRFQKRYNSKVQLIGIASTKDGAPSKEYYREAYQEHVRLGIAVTEGIVSEKEIPNERMSVIQWVTGSSNNRKAEQYATGSKYFISEDGRLYAQVGNEVSLDDAIVQSLMNTRVPGGKGRVQELPIKEVPPVKN